MLNLKSHFLRVQKKWCGLMKSMRDFTGLLHWFPIVTDRIVGLGLKVDRRLGLPDRMML